MAELTIIENRIKEAGLGADLMERFTAFADVSEKTRDTYKKGIRQFLTFLSLRGIMQPAREDIISFKRELSETHKPTTVQNYLIAVRQFFAWLSVEGIYPNIAEHIKGVKLSREHKKDYLNSSQVKDVLSLLRQDDSLKAKRDYAILSLMLTCGLRTIEVVRADVGDLRTLGEHTVVYVQGKGRLEKEDFILVPHEAERIIRDYLRARGSVEPSAPLFACISNKNAGGRMTTRSVSRLVKDALVNAGYDSERLTAHSLRHTAVTLALGTMSLQEVQQFARHANINTTLIYAHNLDKANNKCSDAIASAIF